MRRVPCACRRPKAKCHIYKYGRTNAGAGFVATVARDSSSTSRPRHLSPRYSPAAPRQLSPVVRNPPARAHAEGTRARALTRAQRCGPAVARPDGRGLHASTGALSASFKGSICVDLWARLRDV